MKANELRIGNHFQINGKISQIGFSDFFNIWKSLNKTEIYEPIPLTEEWLAEKTDAKLFPWGWVINEILIRTNMKDKFWVELGNGKRIDLPFVHTLQNFIALTGEELTITP